MSPSLPTRAEMGAPSNAAAVPLMTTEKRLAQSRERLREALHGTPAKPGAAKDLKVSGSTTIWVDRVKLNPAARIVIAAVSSWWAQHPLRVAGTTASATAKAAMKPVARRHPFALVLGAVILGGLLAWTRSWRWALKPALFAGLLPQLVSQALVQAPIRSWLEGFTARGPVPAKPLDSDPD